MESQRLSIGVGQVRERILRCLGDGENLGAVVWSDDNDQVLLHLDTLKCSIVEGWLICELSVNAGDVARKEPVKLQCIYFLGRDDEADGTRASGTVNVGPEGESIADRWGRTLLRVIWDGALDVVEGAIGQASERGHNVVLLGYTGSADEFHVDVRRG